MSEDTSASIRKWSSEIVKWIATALIAICVYFANEIKVRVDNNQTSLNSLNLKMSGMEINGNKISTVERRMEKIESNFNRMDDRVRDLEREK